MHARNILLAGLVGTASLVNALQNVTVYNNDTSVHYTGLSWQPYQNCGGTKYTYSQGQFFTFNFVGTAIYITGTESTEGGIIDISLDGQQYTFDRYSPPPYMCGVTWFSKSGLSNINHTLTVTLGGPSPANSTAQPFLEWQWLLYTQLDAGDLQSLSSGSVAATASGAAASASQTGQSSTSHVSGAAIGGGIAAAVVALIVIGFLVWWFVFRKKSHHGHTYAGRPVIDEYVPEPQTSYGAPPNPTTMMHTIYNPVPTSSPSNSPQMSQAVPLGQTGARVNEWTPDPASAAALAPAVGGAAVGYNGAPSLHRNDSSWSSSQGRAPGSTISPLPYGAASPVPQRTYGHSADPYPASLNPTDTNYAPSITGAASTTGSGSGAASQRPLVPLSVVNSAAGGALPDSEVDRIAARVASMIGQQPVRPPPSETEYDMPPPMYNEKS